MMALYILCCTSARDNLTLASGACQLSAPGVRQKEEKQVKIGIVGIGKMGAAIATRLLGLGHEVVVWNRTAEKAKAVSGVKVAATPRDLATEVETVISILTNAAAIDATYESANGLL